MECFAEIRGIIAKELALDEKRVVPEAHIQEDLGADSLGLFNLAEAIALRFGVELLMDELADMENVNELAKLIESKISSKP
jgi:acyl carrier protein